MKQTAVFNEHKKLGAKIIDFHGWKMPIHYISGIIGEHHAVRNDVGVFDVSHMGELLFKGKETSEKLRGLLTNDIAKIDVNRGLYTHILDENGHILDDTIVFRVGEHEYFAIPNAATTPKVYSWFARNITAGLYDLSNDISCFAVQGPNSPDVLSKIFGRDITALKKLQTQPFKISGLNPLTPSTDSDMQLPDTILVTRSGYTGEDGFEIFLDNSHATSIWNRIMVTGREYGIMPIGLGARDTLRLEMGYLLSGQDFDGRQTTLETNCSWVIKWDHEFIGRKPMLAQKESGNYEKMIGIKLEGKLAARTSSPVHSPHEMVGSVTSGNFSPSLGCAIALARVRKDFAKPGLKVELEVHGKRLPGITVRTPFLNKS